MSTRTCTICGETKPETREHFNTFKNDRNGVAKIGWKGPCKKCAAARGRQHYRDNLEIYRQRTELRKERESHAGPECSDAEKAALKRTLGGCCRYCATPFDGTEELDHLTPVARGGTNAMGNLTYACHACNRAKGSKTLTEYMVFRVERREPVRHDVPAGEAPCPATRAQVRMSRKAS